MFELINLAVIQGITEFLPISSSGHLNLLSYFMNMNTEHLLLFFLILHTGTAFAAIYFFKEDIINIFIGLWDIFQRKSSSSAKEALQWMLLIICVSIPTGIIGIFFKSSVEILGQNLLFLGIAWIITSIILWSTKTHSNHEETLLTFSYKKAFLVGLAQSFAVMPGISRSGATIAMAMLLGANSQFAGRLSFLASFVPIFGGLLIEIVSLSQHFSITQLPLFSLFIGFVVSFITGFLSLKFLMKILAHGKLYIFSIYCLVLGTSVCFIYFLK